MRRVPQILAFVVLCSALLAASDAAKTAFKKGVEAEARQDYEAAYTYYKQAYDLKPTELRYRVPFERSRFMAAADKVHRGQRLRDQGKLQEALVLFEQAAAIDPSNDLAAQEVRRTQQMMQRQSGTPPAATPTPKPEEEDVLRRRLMEARPPVMLNPISDQPVSALEMTSDTKTIYETIGKLAGINVLFDPEFQPRQQLPIKLKGVSLQEALDIVALQSRTFWRAVTPNTIFVAQDTQTKRRELEQNVIKTFYMGNVSGPTDLQDIVNAIRTILEVQRIQSIPSQNALVIKGTPDQLALAQKMVDDIDKSKPEVIVDVIVAQVRRDKIRDLGILPPLNASVALAGGVTTTNNNGTTTTTTTPNLTFNTLEHLTEGNFVVTVDPVKAIAALSDSNTKVMQSPRIRATDNEKATLKIADKIPVATGSFGTPVGVGAVGAGLGVNTQFTFIDVGVIMEITPHVHPDGQITLKTSLEISNQSSTVTIGGIQQPVISQRKVDQTIRLNDGEINLLGGILEDSTIKSDNGTPFLSAVPFLKYIFSQQHVETHKNEIIFLLVPHIVRGQELSDINRRAFDVGTGATIDLRVAGRATPHPDSAPQAAAVSTGQPASPGQAAAGSQPAASGTSAPFVQTRPAVAPQPAPSEATPPASSPASPPGAAAGSPAATAPGSGQLSLRFDPGSVASTQGSTVALNVVLAHGQDITTVSAEIAYDSKLLQFLSVTPGNFLSQDGQPVAVVPRDDAASGKVRISAQRAPGAAGVSGDGTVFNLTFLAKGKGAAAVSITTPGARNSQNQQLAVQGSQASVTIP